MEEKKLHLICRDGLSEIVTYLNNNKVKREDIITIMYTQGEYRAVFFK